jgi:hypothetical protein
MSEHEDQEREIDDLERRGKQLDDDISKVRDEHSEREPMPAPEPDETD